MRPYELDGFLADANRIAQAIAHDAESVQRAFHLEREAERDLLFDVLEAVRPALYWIADDQGPVEGLAGESHRQATIDHRHDKAAPDRSYSWVAIDHPDLGLVIARKSAERKAERVWPGADLPFGRQGGPRLGKALGRLAELLSGHASKKAARKRQEAAALAERLRAVQTLLRGT